MAMSKLTLYADAQVVKRAKRWAAKRHTSLSAAVGRFLRALTAQPKVGELPPITKKASGMVKIPDRPKADLISDALEDKYLRRS